MTLTISNSFIILQFSLIVVEYGLNSEVLFDLYLILLMYILSFVNLFIDFT